MSFRLVIGLVLALLPAAGCARTPTPAPPPPQYPAAVAAPVLLAAAVEPDPTSEPDEAIRLDGPRSVAPFTEEQYRRFCEQVQLRLETQRENEWAWYLQELSKLLDCDEREFLDSLPDRALNRGEVVQAMAVFQRLRERLQLQLELCRQRQVAVHDRLNRLDRDSADSPARPAAQVHLSRRSSKEPPR